MGTRRNFANLSFKSGATCKSRAGGREEFPDPACFRAASERMAQAQRKTTVNSRGHLEGMARAFYQSFFNRYKDLYRGPAMRKDNRNLFSRSGFYNTMQESLWPDAGHQFTGGTDAKECLKSVRGNTLGRSAGRSCACLCRTTADTSAAGA